MKRRTSQELDELYPALRLRRRAESYQNFFDPQKLLPPPRPPRCRVSGCAGLRPAYDSICKACRSKKGKERRRGDIVGEMLRRAKRSAAARGLDFSIGREDVTLPEVCPVFGVKMEACDGMAKDWSYSLDRIDNNKGYVPGNVWVICKRANTIKGVAGIAELELLVAALRKHETPRAALAGGLAVPRLTDIADVA